MNTPLPSPVTPKKARSFSLGGFCKDLIRQIFKHKLVFWLLLLLDCILLTALVLSAISGNFSTVFFSALTFLLLLAPFVLELLLKIEFPATLEIIILFFIFGSAFLGEAISFYVQFPLWDSILHTVNGFLCAAIGFSLADVLNKRKKKIILSPLFLAVVAFCFSMTVGVLWEFFEFFMDSVLHTDMQKDFLITAIRTVTLDDTKQNIVIAIENIARADLFDKDGNLLVSLRGFLDVGLLDTMKDMILNFIGALVFSIIGYIYVYQKGKGNFAKQFIPTVVEGVTTQSPAPSPPSEKTTPTPESNPTTPEDNADQKNTNEPPMPEKNDKIGKNTTTQTPSKNTQTPSKKRRGF